LLQHLELYRAKHLCKFTLADLKALITYNEPQGNQAKVKTKAQGLMRVRTMSSVQAAINRSVLAVAVASAIPSPILAAQAPVTATFYPPPLVSASNAVLDDIRSSFSSLGLSNNV
jgi:hypothetical protein